MNLRRVEFGSLIAASGVKALTSALVHQSVSTRPLERACHEAFIAHKLAVSFAALAFGPFFLVYCGVPTLADSVAFAFGLVPMAAAMLVARTGRIVAARALLFGGLLGFGATLCFGTQAGSAGALAWVMLAQSEAGLAGDRRLTWISGALSCAALATVVALAGHDGLSTASPAFVGGLALAYAITAIPILPAPPDLSHRHDEGESESDRLATLTEALGDLVVDFDAGGSVDRLSGRCESLLGFGPSDLLGRGLFQIVHVADRPAFLTLFADAARDDSTHDAVVRLRARAGGSAAKAPEPHFLWIEIRARRLPRRGRGLAVTAILRDVTQTHRREAAVETAHQLKATAIRSKDDFLANMSHELRTPLNAIIGFSEMLASRTLRPAETDKQREYAQIIHQSGQHLLSVVNSILDMSKIQSGTFAIIPEPFDLAPLIDQCCDIVRLKARDGRIRVLRDCPDGLEQIVGDKRAAKQILINLLSNAVKFTPENGTVRVSVKPQGNAILVTVSDTGIGIAAADLAQIGDPFFQARSSLSRPFEGTGLGLSVVRGLLGLHGGTMSIESEPGKGTSVTVRMPLDCHAIVNKTTSATIETIPRRQTLDHAAPVFQPRIKSIA